MGACCLLLSGCLSENHFVNEFVDEECSFLMTCYDPAILNYLGWSTVDDCVQAEGVRLVTDAEGCTFDPKAGKACLKAMKEPTCPDNSADFTLPAICQDVYVGCQGSTDTGA